MKKLWLFVLPIILIFSIFWLTTSVLAPANRSYISSCEPERFEREFSEDFTRVGRVTLKQSIIEGEVVEEVLVEIFVDDEEVIKHEWIHVKQIENDRIYDCEHTIRKRLNEAEAYAFEGLPNPIFNFFYGEPEI